MPATRKKGSRKTRWVAAAVVIAALITLAVAYVALGQGSRQGSQKPEILYVNQGNGVVNGSGFGVMLGVMEAHGFNTVFFQVYRSGHLLFSPQTLRSFVNQTHAAGLKIYFALYITGASDALPVSIFHLGQDGVSLDMSTVGYGSQEALLSQLKSDSPGRTAVTTTNLTSGLTPDLLVIETYGPGTQAYVRSGVVGSVGVFATSSLDDYRSQLQYALQNSDGVMVFDYYGLVHAGY